jgi:tetratricopeptide (TPR) repeat protein
VQEVREQLARVNSFETDLSQEALARAISKAEEVIRTGLHAFANDSHILAEEAELRTVLKQADRALPPLIKAFAENPKSDLIAIRLGRLLEAKDQIDDAIEILRKALEFNPGKQRLHYFLAQLLLRKQPEAQGPHSASILYHLERSFTSGDNNLEAQFWFARLQSTTGAAYPIRTKTPHPWSSPVCRWDTDADIWPGENTKPRLWVHQNRPRRD